MADHSQPVFDSDVAKIVANKTHVWETIDSKEYCTRCGRAKDDVKLPGEAYQYFPCRGFM
jgi:hypothetical protein